MNHSDIQALMADYLEGDLSLEKRALFDGHLDSCEACATELGDMRRTISLLRALPTPEPPPDLIDNVMRRIREGEGRASWLDRVTDWLSELASPRIAVPVTALAAALAVVLISGDLQLEFPGMPEQRRARQVAAVPSQDELGPAKRRAAEGLVAKAPSAASATGGKQTAASQPGTMARVAGGPETAPLQSPASPDSAPAARAAGGSPAAEGQPERYFVVKAPSRRDSPPTLSAVGSRLDEPGGLVSITDSSVRGELTQDVSNPIPKEQRRLMELDGKLNYVLLDPVEFAGWMGTLSVAEQELWLEELAERAEERGLVESVSLALSESDDTTGQSLASAFASAAERNNPSTVVTPETDPISE